MCWLPWPMFQNLDLTISLRQCHSLYCFTVKVWGTIVVWTRLATGTTQPSPPAVVTGRKVSQRKYFLRSSLAAIKSTHCWGNTLTSCSHHHKYWTILESVALAGNIITFHSLIVISLLLSKYKFLLYCCPSGWSGQIRALVWQLVDFHQPWRDPPISVWRLGIRN